MKTTTTNEVERLDYDAIESVYVTDVPPSAAYVGPYYEQPMRYMVKLVGETRKRRVYAQPIGNVSVLYVKTRGRRVYCESALDGALHRTENEVSA